jgi:hypothetical protein
MLLLGTRSMMLRRSPGGGSGLYRENPVLADTVLAVTFEGKGCEMTNGPRRFRAWTALMDHCMLSRFFWRTRLLVVRVSILKRSARIPEGPQETVGCSFSSDSYPMNLSTGHYDIVSKHATRFVDRYKTVVPVCQDPTPRAVQPSPSERAAKSGRSWLCRMERWPWRTMFMRQALVQHSIFSLGRRWRYILTEFVLRFFCSGRSRTDRGSSVSTDVVA